MIQPTAHYPSAGSDREAKMRGCYNIESPDSIGDWSMRLQLQLLFPKGG